MPGHIKLTKTGGQDPDPTEFLLPSIEMKRADQAKPYDTQKSVWISDPKTGGYREGLLESGDLARARLRCCVFAIDSIKASNVIKHWSARAEDETVIKQ